MYCWLYEQSLLGCLVIGKQKTRKEKEISDRSKSCASASFSHPENMLIWKIKRSAVSHVNDSITHADSTWYTEETNVTNQGSTL